MKVDEHISDAIERFLTEKNLLAKDLCATFGVSEGTFSNWRHVGKGIQEKNWGILFPMIRHYLPQSRIYVDAAGNERYKSAVEAEKIPSPKAAPMTFTTQSVPKFTCKQLEQFNATLESIEQCAERVESARIEYHIKTPGCARGIFAMKTKVQTAVPLGAVVFASTDLKPVDGGIVICLTLDNKVEIGNFSTKGLFFEIQGKDKIFGEAAKILDYVKWIFPVVHYYVVTY